VPEFTGVIARLLNKLKSRQFFIMGKNVQVVNVYIGSVAA